MLILYNDPAPHSVLSLGQTDRQTDGHRTVLILYNDPAAHSVLSLGQTDGQTDGHRTVLILYNDPAAHSVLSLGYSSKLNQPSDWIIPGYYYPARRFQLLPQTHFVAQFYTVTRSPHNGVLLILPV